MARSVKKVNIYEAKTCLSRLIEQVAAGEDIIIARAGTPVARLTRVDRPIRKRRLGLLDGRFEIPDDFNEPLAAEVLHSFGAE